MSSAANKPPENQNLGAHPGLPHRSRLAIGRSMMGAVQEVV